VSGEIDNRVKGVVRGKIWLQGWEEPLILKLEGNACPDLAGCLLKFRNPKPKPDCSQTQGLTSVQEGLIGDLTASRKVRVYDVHLEQAWAMVKRKEKPPEHLANCLYLEWFSNPNGRVVIESLDYKLNISPPKWRLTAEEERKRGEEAAKGMMQFMARLTDAIEQQRNRKDPDEKWDEFDYEKLLRESDARTRKYGELLDKYGHSDEAQEKIAREMGWDKELTEAEAKQERQWIEEMNAACDEGLEEPEPDPAREGIDWVRTKSGEVVHPLQHRTQQRAIKIEKAIQKLGLDKDEDEDLETFLFELHVTGIKMAGALGSVASGVAPPEPGFIVAYLKRALDHLHKSQAALEKLARKILPAPLVKRARKELFEIREALLRLMQDYRSQI